MRLAFHIPRSNYYRLLTPVIDEALGRGLTVECWHDYGEARGGSKGYLFPDRDAAPKFVNGTPAIRTYHGNDELHALLTRKPVDAIVALRPARMVLGRGRSSPVPWALLQDSPGFFQDLTPDDLLAAAAVGVYSPHWLDWGLGVMRGRGLLNDNDPRARAIRDKARVVGFPELDACATLDRASIRAQLGLPNGRPVVTFMPYPYESNPPTFWSGWIYGHPWPRRGGWRQLPPPPQWMRAAMLLARGQHRYWSHVRNGWHDRNLVRAVRAFCDAAGAALLVKYREKDPLPRYVRDVADATVAEPQMWPPAVLDALAVSDLAISFPSATTLEAAFLRVPFLCIGVDRDDWFGATDPVWASARLDLREGGEFNFPGVVELSTIPETIARLPRRRLADFRLDAARRDAYVTRFVGPDDGRSAARMLDLIMET